MSISCLPVRSMIWDEACQDMQLSREGSEEGGAGCSPCVGKGELGDLPGAPALGVGLKCCSFGGTVDLRFILRAPGRATWGLQHPHHHHHHQHHHHHHQHHHHNHHQHCYHHYHHYHHYCHQQQHFNHHLHHYHHHHHNHCQNQYRDHHHRAARTEAAFGQFSQPQSLIFAQPCVEPGVASDDPNRSLPTQVILRFYDSTPIIIITSTTPTSSPALPTITARCRSAARSLPVPAPRCPPAPHPPTLPRQPRP